MATSRVDLVIGREVRAGLELVVVQGLVRPAAVGAGRHQGLVRPQGVERALGEARPHARVAQVGHHSEVAHLARVRVRVRGRGRGRVRVRVGVRVRVRARVRVRVRAS